MEYEYIVRPADDTGTLLIEFLDLPKGNEFIKQLIHALQPISIEVAGYDDLWMNDEIALSAVSDVGSFIIYRDANDRYFITAQDNPGAISFIDAILMQSGLYIKK